MKKRYIQKRVGNKVLTLHRYIMQKYLGHELARYEHVHHINGNIYDNHIRNLQILNWSDHAKQHPADTAKIFPPGENHPNAKFSNNVIERLKIDLATGVRTKELSDKYKMSLRYVQMIKSGNARKTV